MTTDATAQPAPSNTVAIKIDAGMPFVPRHRWLRFANTDNYSRFQDDIIDLRIGIGQVNVSDFLLSIDFTRYDERIRDLMRTFAWCAMNVDHASLDSKTEAVSPDRIVKELGLFKRYLDFLEELGASLSSATIEENALWLAQFEELSYSSRLRAANIPRRVHWYKAYMPCSVSNCHPWAGRTTLELIGKYRSPDENITDRIPRKIIDPLFRWAMFYVNVASKDIFRIIEEASAGKLKGRQCLQLNGCFRFSNFENSDISWHSGVDFDPRKEVLNLSIACYIVTAYLSGMRDGEIQSIPRDCLGVKRDEYGVPYRWSIKATTFKTEGAPVERTWIVLPEVHSAIERLTELSDLMARTIGDPSGIRNGQLLFRRYFFGSERAAPGQQLNASLQLSVTRCLNAFQRSISAYLKDVCQRYKSPTNEVVANYTVALTENGRPWRLCTRQFRRTIAWYIATEPFGTVAGMRQFGQVREVTFLGYAGSPEGGFRDEVERMQRVGQMRDILDLYEKVKGGAELGGGKGRQLEGELSTIAAKIGDLPGKVVDERRLMSMLRNLARDIYPGILNDCFFDAATALCLRGAHSVENSGPIFSRCDWIKCPNSCFWGKHRAAFQLSLDDARQERKVPHLSRNQRIALDQQISKYERALEIIGDAD